MARKVIIDCDPGIDDSVALCMALANPELEVLALTAVEGNVDAEQATTNLHCLLEAIDPPRHPRVGAATAAEFGSGIYNRHMHGNDGLGDCGLEAPDLHHRHPSEKLICDCVRGAPGDVTIIALGPLTNVARALQRDPDLESMIHRIVFAGGSINGIGNVTAGAEFNMHFDPTSARQVIQSSVTKTVIPYDITSSVAFGLNQIDALPSESTRVGSLMRKLLPSLFRAYRQHIGLESVQLHAAVGLLGFTHPELFETQEMECEVETRGEVTRGMTIFDRRPNSTSRSDLEVATAINAEAALEAIMQALGRAAK